MSKGKQVKEDQLQFAMQAAKIGIWDWDVPDDEVIWDDQCKALVGYPDVNGTIDYEFFLATLHPDDRERVNVLVQRTVNQQDENYSTEYRVIWPESEHPLACSAGKGLL